MRNNLLPIFKIFVQRRILFRLFKYSIFSAKIVPKVKNNTKKSLKMPLFC
jgi:hypothetical protein